MNKEIKDAIVEQSKRLDETYWALGDVLDVKASIVLVAVTFLGALSGQILAIDCLPPHIKVVQVFSVLLLVAVGILVLRCLWLKEFELPPKPEQTIKWVHELEEHYKGEQNVSDLVTAEFENQQETLALERIALNSSNAKTKTVSLKWSFRLLSFAVGLEFCSLIWLALRHL